MIGLYSIVIMPWSEEPFIFLFKKCSVSNQWISPLFRAPLVKYFCSLLSHYKLQSAYVNDIFLLNYISISLIRTLSKQWPPSYYHNYHHLEGKWKQPWRPCEGRKHFCGIATVLWMLQWRYQSLFWIILNDIWLWHNTIGLGIYRLLFWVGDIDKMVCFLKKD